MLRSLRLSLTGLLLLGGGAVAAWGQAGAATAGDDVAALRAEVETLRAQAAEREAKLKQLEARNAELETNLTDVRSAVAIAVTGTPRATARAESPSSTLDWGNAMKVATAARFMVKGSSMLTVMPTGSMKPVFDERAILLTEPAKFDDLKVGDIVTYKHPQYGLPVVHRILEKRGDKFWAKGDNNGRMDEVYITRQNFEARVYGIIYANEPSAMARSFSTAAKR